MRVTYSAHPTLDLFIQIIFQLTEWIITSLCNHPIIYHVKLTD
jgi:hypothetical protein